MKTKNKHLIAFEHLVLNRFDEYAKLALDLPYPDVPNAGKLLPEFKNLCLNEIKKGTPPDKIIKIFFNTSLKNMSDKQKTKTLFLFIQFIERQIVLFDALEEAAFSTTHDITGDGSFYSLPKKTYIKNFNTHLVLTAHPTQFYSPQVLSILQDITTAIAQENVELLKDLTLQMANTPFLTRKKPTPIDEAEFLIVYLKNVFYAVCKDTQYELSRISKANGPLISIGFWPGGDRDGNSEVNTKTTIQVASLLKSAIIQCYLDDIEYLKRRLTFKNVYKHIHYIENRLKLDSKIPFNNVEELVESLKNLLKTLDKEHDSLFSHFIEDFLSAVQCFGFHFATLDIRQNSSVHEKIINDVFNKRYSVLSKDEKTKYLESELKKNIRTLDISTILKDDIATDTFSLFTEIPNIQKSNGERGLHRYIISNTKEAHSILEVMLIAKYCGLTHDKLSIDIVPLFETIKDLKNAPRVIQDLFKTKYYKKHLKLRNKTQTIMLGFSDSTKDGGYLTANCMIYKAKQAIMKIAKLHRINVLFFDGRGGPPARGGGNTHQFYKAMQAVGSTEHIELTIQGQTISSNFGSPISAKYNIEQIMTGGIDTTTIDKKLSKQDIMLFEKLSEASLKEYNKLKNHPEFISYLENITPLKYFGELNIASRPPKRQSDERLNLNDLRAIPFVGTWSLMKQNVPAYFGLGTALKYAIEQGYEEQLKILYKDSLFFKTLLDNTMQSLLKTYFPLTQYLSSDNQYGKFWKFLFKESELTTKMLLKISGQTKLLEHDPVIRCSIKLREEIVLPLQIIQQYALISLRNDPNSHQRDIFEKLIKRSMPTNINASRNSA